MMKMIRFLILLPPLFGFGAGAYVYADGSPLRAERVLLALVILAGIFVLRKPIGKLLAPPAVEYSAEKPYIVKARVLRRYLLGEFEIRADHERTIPRSMLPSGSSVETIDRGYKYRVRFPIPGIRIGEASVSQETRDLWAIEDAARAAGFLGKVEEG